MSEITRRQFLKYSGTAGAVVAARFALGSLWDNVYAASPVLTRWVDALPMKAHYTATGTLGGLPLYEITQTQFTQQLHRDLPATTVWGYNGTYPGASFEVRTGQPIYVRWINNLPTTHLLNTAIDRTLDGPDVGPDVRTAVHLHGSNVRAPFDGGPLSWIVPGTDQLFYYDNIQQGATLWYHDHAIGITRLNVFTGLAGFYILRDDVDDSLPIPKLPYDQEIVIQDRMFTAGGVLDYLSGSPATNPAVHPQWGPEFFGDTILVNGKVWPFMQVEPRRYRFRFLNGSDSRFYNMAMSSGQPFYVIGNDGGLLPAPVQVTQLLIAPGERYDCIIDFTGRTGQNILITNNAAAPFPAGVAPAPGTPLAEILQFRVNLPLQGTDTSTIPTTLAPFYPIPEGSVNRVRDLTLSEVMGPGGPLMLLLDGRRFRDPVTQFVPLGTTETWRLINISADTHPIHTHLVQHQILDRQPFNVGVYQATGNLVFTGPAVPPAAYESGWKDTSLADVGMVTRIVARYGSFAGSYVWHCHILAHEDNEMMRPYATVPTKYYFAEGTCRPGFEPYFTIWNTDTGTDGNVNITYMLGNGTTQTQTLTVARNSRQTVYVKGFLGEAADTAHDFSAVVESTNGVQLIVERVMYFDYGGWTDGHATMGALSPSTTWYFAEGTTRPNNDAYITILNPDTVTAANVSVTYMKGNGTSQVQALTVPVTSRATIRVSDIIGSADDAAHDFGAKVESLNGVGIVAERITYFDHGGWNGGHGVIGAMGPAPTWYFAEGTCRPNFDPFITILNPNAVGTANVTITYFLGDGTSRTQNRTVGPGVRDTVRVVDFLGIADDAAHDWSAQVSSTNGVNIVVERPMYFSWNGLTGGSCVMGTVLPNNAYYFAEGSTRPSFAPYLTIMNPNPGVDAAVAITYTLGDGTQQVQNVVVTRSSRATVIVNSFLGIAEDVAHDCAIKVECTNGPQIIVERPMYFNYAGWTGGDSVVGLAY